MGLAQKAIAYIEPEDYLSLEGQSKEKHEYMDGVIYAWQGTTIRGMAGTSVDHARVTLNLVVFLRTATRAKGCEVFSSEIRLRPDQHSAYFYPDVMLRCGAKIPGNVMELDDACLVIEVLSQTTEGFDRQDKFERYKRMASLQTYVLISPDLRTIEIFRRSQAWQVNAASHRYDLGVLDLSLDPSVVFDGL
jgi:Uma2 family endonuclease